MVVHLEGHGGPVVGHKRTVGAGAYAMGRGVEAAIRLPDEAVSSQHAELAVRPAAVVLRDCGSHNGTYLNGVRLQVPTVVADGDLVRCGSCELLVRVTQEEVEPEVADRSEPRLQILSGPERGRLIELRAGSPFTVGRSPHSDLVVDDPVVSREHATFFRQGANVAVLDNDSNNGVLVNGTKVRMIHLANGDEVRIGSLRLRFAAAGEQLPVLPATPTASDGAESLSEPAPATPAETRTPVDATGQPIGKFGPYLLHQELGRGGMGRVFAARVPGHEPVALKVVVFKGLEEDRAIRRKRRFEREVAVLRRIRHEHVVGFRQAGDVEGRPYLAMELLRGPDLAEELRRVGRLPYREAERILFQLCAALGEVHRAGVIHRDLKPANVILHGSQRVVKLTDFGIARAAAERDLEDDSERLAVSGDQPITAAGRHPGTPLYMSPEQCQGEQLDMRSDIWALGVMLYQLVSGRRPFEGATGKEVMHAVQTACPAPLPDDVPGYVRSAVYRCLLKPPAWRFAAATELMDALHERRVEQPLPVGAATVPTMPLTSCPYCHARIAAGRERCPICAVDLHLFLDGRLVQVDVDGRALVCCGGCGYLVSVHNRACERCGRTFTMRRGAADSPADEELTEAEAEALAQGLARLRNCPHCGAAVDPKRLRCEFCGLLLRAHLVGRLLLEPDDQGRDHPHCGYCLARLKDADVSVCPACGLSFVSGRFRDGRPWHAERGAKPKGRR